MVNIAELQETARMIRCDIIEMLGRAGSGHPGGSLSAVEILTALYFNEMRIRPEDPAWKERDKFILSKGHAAPVLYAVLAEKGYFPKSELSGLRTYDHMLQGHPDMNKVPGVDYSTGSLGQGFSAAGGMALAAKLDGSDSRIFTLIGDGESQEGIVWEAAMSAAHYKLDNIIAFMDHNGLQIDGRVNEVMSPEPLEAKWKAFGWRVITVKDGNDIRQILAALDSARVSEGRPTMIICHTVKGKGVSFMEDRFDWHGKAPNKEQTEQALRELREDK